MSRIGKQPVVVPAGVEMSVDGNTVTIKGPRGVLEQSFSKRITVRQEGTEILIERLDDSAQARADHGLYRTLINNMVTGVSAGFTKSLEIVGVGYRATKKGDDIELLLGYSHPVLVKAEDGISFDVPAPTSIKVHGIDKQKVGQVAANIRKWRSPEPYKGKGIRYEGERIRRKLGKAAGK